jgi:hypothetical protein
MELGSKLHRMNDDRLFVRIVVKDDHLEQSTRTIRADDEITALSNYHPQGIADRVVDVLIADSVLTRAVRDLHLDKVTLSIVARQGQLVRCGQLVRLSRLSSTWTRTHLWQHAMTVSRGNRAVPATGSGA